MSAILDCVTSTCFLASTIIGILFIEFALMKTKVVRNVNEERDGKYPSFRRTDVKKWSRLILYLSAPLVPWRILACVLLMVSLLLASKILFVLNKGQPQLSPSKQKFLKYFTQYVSRFTIFFAPGIYWLNIVRPKVDYSKYLGPEWKGPRYDRCSTVVSNHQSWIDIGLVTYLKFPSFTPKAGIKKWPVIGEICDLVFNSLFIDRAGTHEEKEKLVQKIVDRQKVSGAGKA